MFNFPKNSSTINLENLNTEMLTTNQSVGGDEKSTSIKHPVVDQGVAPEVRIANTRSRKLRSPSVPSEKGDEKTTEVPSSDAQQNSSSDHPYAQGGRVLRKKRKSTASDAASPTCTVCGVTVRPSELQNHYEWEVDKLNKLLRPDGSRYREQKADYKERRKTSSSTKRRKDSPEEEDEDDKPLDPEERQKEFEKVKSKRQERLYSRVRKSMRAGVDDDRPSTSSTNADDTTTCPICQIVLTGTADERNSHAEACLIAKSSGGTEEEEDVDIEGDTFEEYTWCGQTRVRVASLLETGYKGLGFEVGNQSNDVDTELNIESDDESAEFGPAQFGEADIIPCASDEMDEQMQTLRNAVLEGSQDRVPPLHQEDSNYTNNCDAASSKQNHQETTAESSPYQSNPLYPGQSRTVLQSLRARIEELEDLVNKQNSVRCLICMESYKTPTVSVQCWHVHCKECWLRTLGAKKLCPQCNMITSPNQLRQIYL
ncbi:E3 ubiquitin-protein ligase RNF220-like [Amphiura filiformis]|uniref:E3 ubiquitin-protein ligase RNF220-like n=1 Tax=Amphiura filiformis TaxID=82378 RepID=UPI003B20F9F0